ncbi:SprT family protein [Bacillus sp. AL-1R]
MDNEEIQKLVEELSITYFNRPFLHQATFNTRLRTTGGRYLLKTSNIELNKFYFEEHGIEELKGIILHELCHYHLHIMKRGYKHEDKDFKELLKKVGAPRYCKPLNSIKKRTHSYKYKYRCSGCGQTFLRKRKVDIKRYVCGLCKSPLKQL